MKKLPVDGVYEVTATINDGEISVVGDTAGIFKGAFVSQWADKSKIAIDLSKVYTNGLETPYVYVDVRDNDTQFWGTNCDLIKEKDQSGEYENAYYAYIGETEKKISDIFETTLYGNNGYVGILFGDAQKVKIKIWDPSKMPTIDATAYEGKTLQVGKNVFVSDVKLPIEGQSINGDPHIAVQMQGGSNWGDWHDIGQSETVYDEETGKLTTTITLSEDDMAKIKAANVESAEDRMTYMLAVSVKTKLSDGSTTYTAIDKKIKFSFEE